MHHAHNLLSLPTTGILLILGLLLLALLSQVVKEVEEGKAIESLLDNSWPYIAVGYSQIKIQIQDIQEGNNEFEDYI